MNTSLLDFIKILPNIATVIAVLIAILAIRENIKSRKTSIRPLLMPSRLKEFYSDDNLFAFNYVYPLAEDIGTPASVYFGIRNVGKGPAKNVKVKNFYSEEENSINFAVRDKSLTIPEGESIPFVIRIERKEQSDYFFITYSTTIYVR